MPFRPIDVVQALLKARRENNRLKLLAFCSPVFAFTYNVDPDKVGNGGTLIGWPAIHAHLDRVARHWVEEHRKLVSISADQFRPGVVHVVFEFRLRNRSNDRLFEGTKRMTFVIRNGIAQSCNEVFDRASVHLVQSFAPVSEMAGPHDTVATTPRFRPRPRLPRGGHPAITSPES